MGPHRNINTAIHAHIAPGSTIPCLSNVPVRLAPSRTHRQDLGVPEDVERQLDAAGSALEAAERMDEEKDNYSSKRMESSPSPLVEEKDSHEGPRRPSSRLSRSQVGQIVAAALFTNGWAPQNHEKRANSVSRHRNSEVASPVTRADNEVSDHAPNTNASSDNYGNTYPEGGFRAWLCVFGSFCGLMAALGMMNTIGTYQAFWSTNQLSSRSPGDIGWIFGMYNFLSFFLGVQIGPIFDAYGPRLLVFFGSLFLTAAQLLLAQSQQYWHFMLSFGVLGGIGTSLIFTPAISSIGHHFLRKRGQAVGLAATGASIGGVVFPLTLQSLIPRIGFTWAARLIALVNLILLLLANMFIRTRLDRRDNRNHNPTTTSTANREDQPEEATLPAENPISSNGITTTTTAVAVSTIIPDFRIFRNLTFTFTTLGVFFTEWALFIPLSYITSYSLSFNTSSTTSGAQSSPQTSPQSYQLLALLNTTSTLGRYLPGLLADHIGRFNTMILTIILCCLVTLGLWLPAQGNHAAVIVFCLLFGFASGSGISLTPVCVGQLCQTENLGRYYATCYTVASFATLTGIPIAGAIVSSGSHPSQGTSTATSSTTTTTITTPAGWNGLILFTGMIYLVALVSFIAARVRGVGWKISKIY